MFSQFFYQHPKFTRFLFALPVSSVSTLIAMFGFYMADYELDLTIFMISLGISLAPAGCAFCGADCCCSRLSDTEKVEPTHAKLSDDNRGAYARLSQHENRNYALFYDSPMIEMVDNPEPSKLENISIKF